MHNEKPIRTVSSPTLLLAHKKWLDAMWLRVELVTVLHKAETHWIAWQASMKRVKRRPKAVSCG